MSKCSAIQQYPDKAIITYITSWEIFYYYFLLSWDITLYSPGWPVPNACSQLPPFRPADLYLVLPTPLIFPFPPSSLSFCFPLASTWENNAVFVFVKWFISLNIMSCHLSISSKEHFILLYDLAKAFKYTHSFSHSFVDGYPDWICTLAILQTVP